MRSTFAALVLLSLAPAAALAASNRGFQLEVEALGSRPIGTYVSGDRATDLFDAGGNAFGKALYGLSRGLTIGVGVGYLHSQGSFSFQEPISRTETRTVSATRSITATPVLALGQLHTDMHNRFGIYGEGGLGLASLEARVSELSNGDQPTSNFQLATAFSAGGGMWMGAGRNWEFTLGAGWLQTFTGNGDAFQSGDNPAYLTLAIGVRYPRW